MTSYPVPDFESPFDLFIYANTISGGWFTSGVLLALFIVVFSITKIQNLRNSVCMVISSTVCFLMASLLWAGGALSGQIVIWLLVLDMICVIWAKLDE